jgi:hypothetical protein
MDKGLNQYIPVYIQEKIRNILLKMYNFSLTIISRLVGFWIALGYVIEAFDPEQVSYDGENNGESDGEG